MKAVDLFAGAGGLSLGLARAGFEVVLANEFSVDPEWTYRSNLLAGTPEGSFPPEPADASAQSRKVHRARVRAQIVEERKLLSTDFARRMRGGHVRDVLCDAWLTTWREQHPEIDLLVAGPPCQGFSSAGARDADDERNLLVGEALRIVRVLRPKVVVIENVPGMLHRHTDLVADVGRTLTDNGYFVAVELLHAADLGVPQTRKRLLLVGVRDDVISGADHAMLRGLVYPTGCPSTSQPLSQVLSPFVKKGREYTSAMILGDLGQDPPAYGGDGSWETPHRPYVRLNDLTRELRAARARYLAGGIADDHDRASFIVACANHEAARHDSTISERLRRVRETAFDNPDFRCRSSWIKAELGRTDPLLRFTKKASQRVLLPDRWPMLTVTSLPDDIVHHEENRIPTVREVARLQSFPDWFVFRGVRTTGAERRRAGIYVPQFTQVANAVPPRLAHALAARLRQFLMCAERRDWNAIASDGGIFATSNRGLAAEVLQELNELFQHHAGTTKVGPPSKRLGLSPSRFSA